MPRPLLFVDPDGEMPADFAQVNAYRIREGRALSRALGRYMARTTWVAPRVASVARFLPALRGREGRHRLLVLEPVAPATRHGLYDAFRTVLSPGDGVALVKPAELSRILSTHDWNERYVGAAVDRALEVLVLYRADLTRDRLPMARVEALGAGDGLDPEALAVEGRGLVVRLGGYTLAADRVLYELSPSYRRRTRKERLFMDRSFGASVRRLRKARGIRRTGFPGVSAKTIARIERGEVTRPNEWTLATLARVLGVPEEELGNR